MYYSSQVQIQVCIFTVRESELNNLSRRISSLHLNFNRKNSLLREKDIFRGRNFRNIDVVIDFSFSEIIRGLIDFVIAKPLRISFDAANAIFFRFLFIEHHMAFLLYIYHIPHV